MRAVLNRGEGLEPIPFYWDSLMEVWYARYLGSDFLLMGNCLDASLHVGRVTYKNNDPHYFYHGPFDEFLEPRSFMIFDGDGDLVMSYQFPIGMMGGIRE